MTYEFFYTPDGDAVMTHPALGRLAFLLQPEGVRVHWITDGDVDSTGLPDTPVLGSKLTTVNGMCSSLNPWTI